MYLQYYFNSENHEALDHNKMEAPVEKPSQELKSLTAIVTMEKVETTKNFYEVEKFALT